MPKFVFMPPQDDLKAMFAARLADTVPEYDVVSPETDEEAVEAIRDADAVVNLVGILFQNGRQRFDAVQAGGAAAIAQLAADAGVTRLVHVSAIGADPESDSLYARTKGEAEEAVRRFTPSASILRPSVVFGPEDDFFNKFAAMATLAPALPLIGGGGTRFQPVYVDDVADAICEALARPEAEGRTYELGGPRVYTFKELLELMLSETGRKRFLAPLPFPIASMIGAFGEIAGALPFVDPPLTRDQVRLLKNDNVVTDAEGVGTLADLGVAPRTVESVLPSYMVRYRKYGQFAERTV